MTRNTPNKHPGQEARPNPHRWGKKTNPDRVRPLRAHRP